MVFSYEQKVIIKYLGNKYKYGTARIANDYPEYKLKVNSVKKLLKMIGDTNDVAQHEGSGRSKSVRTE